ncbi:LysE family translocator [Pseudomonas sp. MNR3A]|uniref:LysE family translocator n=1 Tax=Pseudomonas sp. MNR3A TaxID=2615213 RepID=UPI00129A4979|nr:LysE family translocator [Pseudomonas sp. MNR3A]
MANLELFIGALVAVCLVPGADMVLVLHTSSTQGRAYAVATAVGLAIARAVHVTLAALGLAVLLKTVGWAFELVRVVGVVYLIWLGLRIARAPSLVPDLNDAHMPVARRAYGTAVWRGLLTNISNPKALLFCSVLLPQFIDASVGEVGGQFLLLGVVLVIVGLLFDLFYAMIGAALGYWMARNPKVEVVQRWTFASLLIGFGLRLALIGRPQ